MSQTTTNPTTKPMVEHRVMDSALEVRRETREDGTEAPAQIVGHAAVFDEWTTLYDGQYFSWREVVRPGAFGRAIKKKQDVRALFNHDANFVLGRTKSGTLAIEEDQRGLLTKIEPPDTQAGRDLMTSIGRGDVSQMSFAFSVSRGKKKPKRTEKDGVEVIEDGGERITIRYEGEKRFEERELLDLDLFDVSPVTYPAYEGTDVGIRSAIAADIEKRATELDVPHRRPAPVRDALRTYLGL
jgi:uncharacterized protein